MFARYASVSNSVAAADAAVEFSPADPEAHRARASVLNRLQRSDDAAKSLETAVALRYRDDYLWIELGNTREELGDAQGALAALDQAVVWAPYYAHTHWQRGNLLLRMGRANEGFSEMRSAAAANPRYTPNLIDLAWGISRNDPKTTEALLESKDDTARLAFIRFLAQKGKGSEVVDQIRFLTTPLSTENKHELARQLFAAKAFTESFDLWRNSAIHEASFLNGDFEEPLVFGGPTFGWVIAPEQKHLLAIDVSEKLSGSKSLRINSNGDWTPGVPLLAQTLILKPNTTYRLSFSVKTHDLVTGGPPFIVVNDAASDQLLGKSENFPTTTTPWTRLKLDFTTLAASQAAVIRLQRNNCDSSPCPIFGTLWLDEFSVDQTESAAKR